MLSVASTSLFSSEFLFIKRTAVSVTLHKLLEPGGEQWHKSIMLSGQWLRIKYSRRARTSPRGRLRVLIKYGCLSSLPRSDRWGQSAYFGVWSTFFNQNCIKTQASVCSHAPWRPTLLTQAENRLSKRPLVPGRKFPTGIFFSQSPTIKEINKQNKEHKIDSTSPQSPCLRENRGETKEFIYSRWQNVFMSKELTKWSK